MNKFFEQAKERLEKEAKELHDSKYIGAMKNDVRDALLEFCGQDEEFAQAVAQGGSFKDCMEAVAKGVHSSISDLEAYRRAAAFYFPGSSIRFEMRIDLCASVNSQAQEQAPKKDGIVLSLADFF